MRSAKHEKGEEVRKTTQNKENKPHWVIAIAILYAWQLLNFWTHQDLINHYLECRQENVELRQKVQELRQKVQELHQKVLELEEDILAPLEEIYNILIDFESQ